MSADGKVSESYLREMRLFLEETCCNLCRLRHVEQSRRDDLRITQESFLGIPGAFADLRIEEPGTPPYFIEVKYGYSPAQTAKTLARKYGPASATGGAAKVIVVLDDRGAEAWPSLLPKLRAAVRPDLELELWSEATILSMLRDTFGLEIDSLSGQHLLEVRVAMDRAIGRYAFEDSWADDPLQNSLIWHLGSWRIRQIRSDAGDVPTRNIMPPGLYKNAVVVMADLCAFSSYLRDTREDDVVRHCLTTFYAKARYEILNSGGMMYQFVGDEVIGLFGVPDRRDGYIDAAAACARALADIGNSVSSEWQRKIDRVQSKRGVHIGIAMGDMQVVSLRPFSRAHLGGIGEVINMAARLLSEAGPSEAVVTNTYYQALSAARQAEFEENGPVEARNMGTIKAWRASFGRC